jgi:hypothetical protein
MVRDTVMSFLQATVAWLPSYFRPPGESKKRSLRRPPQFGQMMGSGTISLTDFGYLRDIGSDFDDIG